MNRVALGVDLAWIAITPILFRLVGPRWGALAGVLGGYVLLPMVVTGAYIVGPSFPLDKAASISLGLLLGMVLFGRDALLRLRPRWIDLPMAAFLVSPLASLAANGFKDPMNSALAVWTNLMEWVVPYLAGRALADDRDGPRRVAIAVVAAGLATIPICVYEVIAGPKRYLLGLLYGVEPHWHMVDRLGGWRPEGFFASGVELSVWMALATVTAAWGWLTRAWQIPRLPAWAPFLALLATTIACRGVYGFLALAVGLATVLATRVLGTRAFVVALALIPPAYMISRITHAWDGHQLTEIAGLAGRPGTVGYRLSAETQYIEKVEKHGLAFGFGPIESAIFDFWSQSHLWSDGHWIHLLRLGGAVGLAAYTCAFLLMPVALSASWWPGRPRRPTPWPKTWGLALFVVLLAIDDLHNMARIAAMPLIVGSIAGFFLSGPAAWMPDPRASRLPQWRDVLDAFTGRAAFWLTVLVLVAVEVLGLLTRADVPAPSSADPPAASR